MTWWCMIQWSSSHRINPSPAIHFLSIIDTHRFIKWSLIALQASPQQILSTTYNTTRLFRCGEKSSYIARRRCRLKLLLARSSSMSRWSFRLKIEYLVCCKLFWKNIFQFHESQRYFPTGSKWPSRDRVESVRVIENKLSLLKRYSYSVSFF